MGKINGRLPRLCGVDKLLKMLSLIILGAHTKWDLLHEEILQCQVRRSLNCK